MSLPPFLRAAGLILGFAIFAGASAAEPALHDETTINEPIIDIGIAIEISDQCRSIAARTFAGIALLNQLERQARALGYSSEQIDAYIHDRTEKRRLIAIARARLAEWGAVEGDGASYCAVGRAQMAANTQVGSLLR